jgi:hypothetical protein
MTQLDNLVRGHSIARLIKKHGGWLDDNDKEIIRFPTPHALAMFEKDIEAARSKEQHG